MNEKDYPYNLLCIVLGEEPETLAPDFDASVEYVLSTTLTEKESSIIRQRYKDGLTYAECGKILGVTRERIRQIESKAIRKLRYPSRLKFLCLGVLGVIKEVKMERAEHYGLVISECMQKVMDAININGKVTADEKPDLELDELELSVRSYNCLRRAGVNRVSDIIRMDYDQLTKLRNMGKKSHDEIIAVLKELGYTTSHLETSADNGAK